ncbi:hypothetical protein [Sphingomonas sp. LHG3406-1]|uniref:hypothetical protein n=1 Tax=Sphingomonas sp. LHG3406-1 TaxID=2804617 RepID=UPI002617DEF1|nr:hypothetical protein [Sphingomonas sp. LHG3406-1]
MLFFIGVAAMVESIPDPIRADADILLMVPVFVALAALVGFLPGLAGVGIGTLILSALCERLPAARSLLAWMVAGALLGGALPLLAGAPPALLFAFSAGGAVSALICRLDLRSGTRDGYRPSP